MHRSRGWNTASSAFLTYTGGNKVSFREHAFESCGFAEKQLKKSDFSHKKIKHLLAFYDYKKYNKIMVVEGG